ncbi:glycosyltransferase [Lactobacillus delbrueckii]|uniref:glycosyltransferase n=1 Tax=Lactobacillus delbrueckii TaxID=1584 RepID=UPI0039C8AC80
MVTVCKWNLELYQRSASVGKPVVATSVDETPKIVRNNYNGFLVKPRDYESLAKKISYALDINAPPIARIN